MTFTIPASGTVLSTLTANIDYPLANYCAMSISKTGACPGDANFVRSLYLSETSTTGQLQMSNVNTFTGLTPGAATWRVCYISQGGTCSFSYRELTVLPLS